MWRLAWLRWEEKFCFASVWIILASRRSRTSMNALSMMDDNSLRSRLAHYFEPVMAGMDYYALSVKNLVKMCFQLTKIPHYIPIFSLKLLYYSNFLLT